MPVRRVRHRKIAPCANRWACRRRLARRGACSYGAGQIAAELESLSEPLSGPSISAVAQAVEATGVAAGVGWLERGDDGALYNSDVMCMPGGAKHRHGKVHATKSPHLRSGDRFDVYDTPWGAGGKGERKRIRRRRFCGSRKKALDAVAPQSRFNCRQRRSLGKSP